MPLLRILLLLTSLAFALPSIADEAERPALSSANSASTRLATGDTLRIVVFGEEDLSVTAKIGEQGQIAYPFLGEIAVAGLSLRDIEKLVAKKLDGDYLINPRVTASITEYRPFFVNGQVRSPGGYPFQPGMTVRKAITLAGGLTERGSEKRITLISENRKQSGKKRKVGLDDTVGPGDVLTIDESFF